MAKSIWFISYKLVKGTAVEEFLAVSQKVHEEVLSQQKGFVSWRVLQNGDTWVDEVVWESQEDAEKGETAGQDNPSAQAFYSMIEMESCQNTCYALVKEY